MCIDKYKLYEGDDNEKKIVCLKSLRNKKSSIKTELLEKYKKMDKDFDRNQ